MHIFTKVAVLFQSAFQSTSRFCRLLNKDFAASELNQILNNQTDKKFRKQLVTMTLSSTFEMLLAVRYLVLLDNNYPLPIMIALLVLLTKGAIEIVFFYYTNHNTIKNPQYTIIRKLQVALLIKIIVEFLCIVELATLEGLGSGSYYLGYYLCFKFHLLISMISSGSRRFTLALIQFIYSSIRLQIYDHYQSDCFPIFWLVVLFAVANEFVHIKQSIINQVDLSNQLLRQPNIYKDTLDMMTGSGVIILSSDQHILYENTKMKNMFSGNNGCSEGGSQGFIAQISQMQILQYNSDSHSFNSTNCRQSLQNNSGIYQAPQQFPLQQQMPSENGESREIQSILQNSNFQQTHQFCNIINNTLNNNNLISGSANSNNNNNNINYNNNNLVIGMENTYKSNSFISINMNQIFEQLLKPTKHRQLYQTKTSVYNIEQDEIIQNVPPIKQNSIPAIQAEGNSNQSEFCVLKLPLEGQQNNNGGNKSTMANGKGEQMKNAISIKVKLGQNYYDLCISKYSAVGVGLDGYSCIQQDALIVVAQDISIQQENEQLKYEQAQQQQIMAQTAHEFRTPLNCSILMLEKLISLMLQQGQPDLVNQFLTPTLHSQKLLLSLIHDILDFSQINAGKFTISFQNFNIRKLVQKVLLLMSIQAELKGVQLVCSVDQNVPLKFYNDPNRLRQILLNLISKQNSLPKITLTNELNFISLMSADKSVAPIIRVNDDLYTTSILLQPSIYSNALKFTKEGSIMIKVEVSNANCSSESQRDVLLVSVIDTGIGIKKEQLDKLFKCFGKIENKENKRLNSQGVGLGLVISHMLSLRLGPQGNQGIRVESEYGQGSTFKFLIAELNDEKEFHQSEMVISDSIVNSSDINVLQNQQSRGCCQQPNVFVQNSSNSYFDGDIINQSYYNAQGFKQDSIDQNNNSELADSQDCGLGTIYGPFVGAGTTTTISKQPALTMPTQSIDQNITKNNFKNLGGKKCNCPKILVVDDNQFNVIVFKQVFSDIMPAIEVAYSGEEALEKIHQKYQRSLCCKHYLIIFMDIDMPGINGYQATREIIKIYDNYECPKYYIIGCSGYENDQEKQKSLKEGMNYYLQKPIDKKQMKKILKQIQKEFQSLII